MIKYALFDLDGTLGSPYEGVHRCFLHGLEYLGIKADPNENMDWIMGPPLRYSYAKMGLSNDDIETAILKYRELYSVEGVHQAQMYKGIPECLERLRDMGITIVLASCKPTPFCEIMLSDFGIRDYFDFVSGASFDKSLDGKTEIIKVVMNHYGIEYGNEAVMIGDRSSDIEGGHNNGILAMGVAYGYGTVREFMEADADFIAGSPGDIADTIYEYQNTIGKLF